MKKETKILLLIVVLSFLLRWFFISGNNIIFWFDQSRDAQIATNIIADRDLKILGPSASGTNDSVYHGVMYYYFLAPLYYFGAGNPLLPTLALSFIGCLGVFPLFYFSKSLFASKLAAWLAVAAYVFSVEAIQLSSWLFNPSLALLPLIIFYWSLWEVAYKNKKSFTLPLFITLGIAIQSALWLVYLLGPLLLGILYNLDHFAKKTVFKDWKNNLINISLFLLIISSIIIGQFFLWKNGIFKLSNLTSGGNNVIAIKILTDLILMYFTKILNTINPLFIVFSLIILLLTVGKLLALEPRKKHFFLSWFLAPFWLFIIEPRNSLYILISLEIALILFLSFLTAQLWKRKKPGAKTLAAALVLIFIISNLLTLQKHKAQSISIFSSQQNSNLADQLALIDYSYEQAKGADFTFSVFSNPYGYYITWAYLYDWYGLQKYGYKPGFVGPDQTGLFGEDLLERDDVAREKIHFTIIEPNLETVPLPIKNQFDAEQDRIGPIVEQNLFGSSIIYLRNPSLEE